MKETKKTGPEEKKSLNEEKPSELSQETADRTPPAMRAPEKDEYTLEVIKDWYGKVDPFTLSNKDPKYEYRFLKDEFKNLSMKTGNMLFQKGGWQLVNRAHLKKLGIADEYIAPDGLYRVGDTVLARIPKELYAEKREYKQKQADAPMNMIKRTMKKGDNASEISSGIHESMKGLQTAKDLGMKS